MQFRDGSIAMVPKEKIVDAMYDSGELLHPMRFPDGSEAMVPHSKLAGAFKDGGQRLDTQPIKAASWEDYLGAAFGAATDTTLGAETGEKSLGQDVSQGLWETSSGHWVKGPARVAGATIQAAAPVLGAGRIASEIPMAAKAAPEAAKAVGQAAGEIPEATLRNLYRTWSDTTRDADVAAGTIEGQGAAKLLAMANKGLEEAKAAGDTSRMVAMTAAKRASQVYGTYSNISTWLDKTVPNWPMAWKIYAGYEIAKYIGHALWGDDKEDARKTLFGEK